MACFNVTTCPNDQIFYGLTCNYYTYPYRQLNCNSTITCKRMDGKYDCCTSNIAYCTIELLLLELIPTINPTITSNIVNACEHMCNLTLSTNKCHWYESQNLDISCIDKDNSYCCSHERKECCKTNIAQTYIILGSSFIIISLCVFYKYFVYKYTQIVPDEPTSNCTFQHNNKV